MTLRVVCGSGHVSVWDGLTDINSLSHTYTDDDGTPHRACWDWDYWRCKVADCSHPEYVSHVIDKEFVIKDEENKKGAMLAFLLLAMFLSRKAIGGV